MKTIDVDGVPAVVFDDVFDETEMKNIWRTIDSIDIPALLEPIHTGSASDGNRTPIKQNSGVFLDQLINPELSHLCPLLKTIHWRLPLLGGDPKEIKDIEDAPLLQVHPYLRGFYTANYGLLLSYYEEDDHYKKHVDSTSITALMWFCKDEEAFTGGDLLLGKSEVKVEFRNNRVVLIPGWMLHEVEPIVMNDGYDASKGLGRWCLSAFYSP